MTHLSFYHTVYILVIFIGDRDQYQGRSIHSLSFVGVPLSLPTPPICKKDKGKEGGSLFHLCSTDKY